MSEINRQFMLQALELGEQVRGHTGDNPWAGSVIVKDGKVLGKGNTHPPGGPHAEAEAIRNAEAQGYNVSGAILYCTLEPCSFHGRTPSCAKTIVEKQIAHVVIAIRDPHPQVNGEGIRILREGGVKITEGMEDQRVRQSLQIWLSRIEN